MPAVVAALKAEPACCTPLFLPQAGALLSVLAQEGGGGGVAPLPALAPAERRRVQGYASATAARWAACAAAVGSEGKAAPAGAAP